MDRKTQTKDNGNGRRAGSKKRARELTAFRIAACLAFAALPLHADNLPDPEIFLPELFPELADVDQTEVMLHGLHALFPERVFRGAPDEDEPAEPLAPLVKTVGDHTIYVRAYHLGETVPVLREHLSRPVVILDLRYVASDLESATALGSILTRQPELQFHAVGDYPLPEETDDNPIVIRGQRLRTADQTLIVLSNWETSGPVEVLLEQLRRNAEMISIGTPSAGHTASYRRYPDRPEWRILSGELRPDPDVSLVDHGFRPGVNVTIAPEVDLVAYRRLTADIEIDAVVQIDTPAERPRDRRRPPLTTPAEPEPPEEPPPLYVILQRAVNIVRALEALGRIPG